MLSGIYLLPAYRFAAIAIFITAARLALPLMLIQALAERRCFRCYYFDDENAFAISFSVD